MLRCEKPPAALHARGAGDDRRAQDRSYAAVETTTTRWGEIMARLRVPASRRCGTRGPSGSDAGKRQQQESGSSTALGAYAPRSRWQQSTRAGRVRHPAAPFHGRGARWVGRRPRYSDPGPAPGTCRPDPMTEQGEGSVEVSAHRDRPRNLKPWSRRRSKDCCTHQGRAQSSWTQPKRSDRHFAAYRKLSMKPGFTDTSSDQPILRSRITRLAAGSAQGPRAIEDLRAIPWGFRGPMTGRAAGWCGFGSASSNSSAARPRARRALELLQRMHRQWPFFVRCANWTMGWPRETCAALRAMSAGDSAPASASSRRCARVAKTRRRWR